MNNFVAIIYIFKYYLYNVFSNIEFYQIINRTILKIITLLNCLILKNLKIENSNIL